MISEIEHIFHGAAVTILQVFVTCLPGVLFARTGIITGDVRRALSRLSFNLLLPAVTFSNIAPHVNVNTIIEWWPIFLNVLLSTALGLIVGSICSKLLNVPKRYRGAATACAGFGNMNSLPLMLVYPLCYNDNLPFNEGNPGRCSNLATAFVALGSSTNSIFAYSFATWLLSRPTEELTTTVKAAVLDATRTFTRLFSLEARPSPFESLPPYDGGSERAPLLRGQDARTHGNGGGGVESVAAAVVAAVDAAAENGGIETPLLQGIETSSPPYPHFEDNNDTPPLFTRQTSMVVQTSEFEPPESETTVERAWNTPAALQALCRRFWLDYFWAWIQPVLAFILKILPVPALASLVGIFVGVITPLHDLFYPIGGAPLSFLTASIHTWGVAMVFVSSFVLGAVLANGPGPGMERLGLRPVVSVVAIRLLITPIVGKSIVFATYYMGWWKLPEVAGETFFFILLLQHCMPTANNVQNIATMLQHNEKEVGAMLFWQYLLSLGTIPLWMTLDLTLMRRFGIVSP